MRIVHLSTRKDYYGGEVCLTNLVRGLAGRGHHVSCLVQPESALAARLVADPVTVVELPMVDWYDPGTIRRVRAWLQGKRVDILATHLPRDYFIAAVATLGLPVCNIATRHVLNPISWPWLKRPFLRRFEAMVAVSEAVADTVQEAGLVPDKRVMTVPNGIAPPVPVGALGRLRHEMGVSSEALVIGFVGRLSPDKGPAVILRAAAKLVARFPEVKVFMVGAADAGSGYLRYLEGLAGEINIARNVHFLGYVPDVANHGCEFDIQVVTSQAEPFGLVTLEAMANGVPVVVTATGGSREIVRDGIDGFLVPPGDSAALANRLECLLGSSGLRREMGRRGQERFHRRFTLARMVTETERVYARALCDGAGAKSRGPAKAGPHT